MSGRGFEQEGLLQDHLVAGIFGQRLAVEIRGGGGVMIATRDASGQIIAEQRAGILGVDGRKLDLGIGSRRGKKDRDGQSFLRPPANRGFIKFRHVATAWRRPVFHY